MQRLFPPARRFFAAMTAFLLFFGTGCARADAEIIEPNGPFFWRIEGEQPDYLFGTIHLGTKEVMDSIPPNVYQAIDACDELYAELPMDEAMFSLKMIASVIRKDSRPLKEVLGAEMYARLLSRLEKMEISPIVVERQSLWVIATTLPMMDRLQEMQANPAVDMIVYGKAKMAGKKVGGLETIDEQLAVFTGFSEPELVAMIGKALDGLDEAEKEGKDPIDELVDLYIAGDLASMVELAGEQFDAEDPVQARLGAELVDKRNLLMAERIEAHLKSGPGKTHFFAVGTLHYPGETGILAQLRKRGYKVTRLTAESPIPMPVKQTAAPEPAAAPAP